MKTFNPKYIWLFTLLLFVSCATYYQKNEALMNAVYTGKLDVATKLLSNDAKFEKSNRNKLLFYLNKGTILWMNQDYIQSNVYFRKADYFVEDYNKNYGQEALALLTNPKVITYTGETFEQVLIHYYGALNYLMLNQHDEALVEAKRMLSKLQRITDKFKSNNKYKFDAFAHNLTGIIYESTGDINNAFIAYKNAYKIYNEDYTVKYNTQVPQQLKQDLLRLAYLNGFYDDVTNYEKLFKTNFNKENAYLGSDLVCFWNNGFGPVKDVKSINFTIIPYAGHPGWVEITNWDLGLSFPFNVGDDKSRKDMLDMKIIRLALPKYISRKPLYQNATLKFGDTTLNFNLAEDVNAIAYKSLEDRMVAELSKGIMRVVSKQLMAYLAQKENKDGLALAAQLYGAISEQADTRNWQLLPYNIHYTRIRLPLGNQSINFKAVGSNNTQTAKTINATIVKGKTAFCVVQTPEFNGYAAK